MRRSLSRRRLFNAGAISAAGAVGLWLPLPTVQAQTAWDGPQITARGGVSNGRSLYWAAVVENTNIDAAITNLEIETTFMNRAGTVVASDTEYVSWLAPGQSLGLYGSDFMAQNEESGALAVRVVRFTWKPLGQPSFEDVSYVPGRFSNSVQGVIRNPYPVEFTDLEVVAVCRSGERVVGGGSEYVRRLAANGSSSLDITAHVSVPPDRVDLYAQW